MPKSQDFGNRTGIEGASLRKGRLGVPGSVQVGSGPPTPPGRPKARGTSFRHDALAVLRYVTLFYAIL